MDKGKYCAALFVDLTKAFNTVDHALLLQSLNNIGFNSNSLKSLIAKDSNSMLDFGQIGYFWLRLKNLCLFSV